MRSWLEIDLAAIVSNARSLASLVAPATLCAVVKSNAYGHGLVPVCEALESSGIPGLSLAVFAGNEAMEARRPSANQPLPLLVVGPVADEEIAPLVAAGVQFGALDTDDARRLGRHGATVHLKVDTGLSRFGVAPSQARESADSLVRAGATVAGVYSHLSSAEELDAERTKRQLALLEAASAAIAASGGMHPRRHIAASAAAMLWPEMRLDMVRCGIALYGHWPSQAVRKAVPEPVALRQALRWIAPVAHVREIESGDTVGYGCEWTATRRSVIAVLPVGYADGLPRAAGGGRFAVRFAGGSAPIVGRICMNASMVDVTDLRPLPVRGDDAEIGIADVARAAGTIEYEILARLPAALERRYTS